MTGLRDLWIERARTLMYLAGAAFLIAALAFINRYPFVYSDSGSYIRSAFNLLPLDDRPIGYGFIIRAVTWQSTLWTVVLFQGFMTGWLLLEVLKQLLPGDRAIWRIHLVVVVVLMLLTSMPWYAAQLMPDALTPLTAMVLYLLLFGRGIGPVRQGFLWICLFFFLMSHYSHVGIAVLALMCAIIPRSIGARGMCLPGFWVKWAGACATTLLCIGFVTWYNARHGLRPVFSPAAHVYFAGRLCENDVMGSFLREHCGERDYPLCPYKDELPLLPGDLIWPSNSIVNRMGLSMEQADSTLAPMVKDLLSEPRYLGRYLKSALISTAIQLFQVNTGSGIVSFHLDSSPYFNIKERLPWEAGRYITSVQAHNGWGFDAINRIHFTALLLAVLVLFLAWPRGPDELPTRCFLRAMIAWVFLNALVTAGLANAYDRLQSRVVWLVVLAACVALLRTPAGQRISLRLMRPHG